MQTARTFRGTTTATQALVSNEKSKTQADTDKDSDIVATAAKSDIRSDSASDSARNTLQKPVSISRRAEKKQRKR